MQRLLMLIYRYISLCIATGVLHVRLRYMWEDLTMLQWFGCLLVSHLCLGSQWAGLWRGQLGEEGHLSKNFGRHVVCQLLYP